MTRAIDALSILLLAAALASFGGGLGALGERDDLRALYLLAVGAALLRGSTQLLRPAGPV